MGLFVRTREVIEASLYGSLTLAAIQGALGALAFWVLGVPSPLLWGAVMVLACLIPVLGSGLVWGPVAVYLLATGQPVKALILTAWGALVISNIDNVLRPKLVGPRARMHELIVFFAVLGGLQVFGMLGFVTGPAVAAVAMALFDVWRRTRPPAPAVVLPPAAGAGELTAGEAGPNVAGTDAAPPSDSMVRTRIAQGAPP